MTSGLRRLVAAGVLSADRAADARADAAALPLRRYPHQHLLSRAWELRGNATIYDGVYLALAELLGYALVTTDARLARIPGHAAQVEVFAA